jgi:hypothetical protein
MYYVNLGLLGYRSPSGDIQVGYGVSSPTVVSVDGVAFYNVRNAAPSGTYYWSQHDTVFLPGEPTLCSHCVWYMDFGFGFQGSLNDYSGIDIPHTYVWAVRDGDVAAVPEPSSYVLLFFGLGLIGAATRRRGVSAASLDHAETGNLDPVDHYCPVKTRTNSTG